MHMLLPHPFLALLVAPTALAEPPATLELAPINVTGHERSYQSESASTALGLDLTNTRAGSCN